MRRLVQQNRVDRAYGRLITVVTVLLAAEGLLEWKYRPSWLPVLNAIVLFGVLAAGLGISVKRRMRDAESSARLRWALRGAAAGFAACMLIAHAAAAIWWQGPGEYAMRNLLGDVVMSAAFSMLIGVFPGAICGVWVGRYWERRRRRKFPEGHCQTCGYDLRGNVSGRCPECGVGVELERSE